LRFSKQTLTHIGLRVRRSVSTCIELPLRMCGKVVPPVKNAAFKITIDTNRPPPSLPALFEDVCPQVWAYAVANSVCGSGMR
jgi:hypothetical protein